MTEPDPFFESIAEVRDAVTALLQAARLDEPKPPDAASKAMQELATQETFVEEWGAGPVDHAYVVGAWKRGLAVDCAEAMIRDLH
ncbi:unnamed protein product, partial [marine sediment metagenome]